jgi:multiple antibiotic resistance protein
MDDFLLVFIPLFVAIDPLGLVPVFLSVTEGMEDARRRRTSFEPVASASVICIGFMFLGEAIFRFLGIAGGVILLVLAVLDRSELATRQ